MKGDHVFERMWSWMSFLLFQVNTIVEYNSRISFVIRKVILIIRIKENKYMYIYIYELKNEKSNRREVLRSSHDISASYTFPRWTIF